MDHRTLHLIDLENLAGGGALSFEPALSAANAYRHHVPVGPGDLVTVATGPSSSLAANQAFPTARLLIGRGVDGADRALLQVLTDDPAIRRVDQVVVASGDGIFAAPVRDLTRTAVYVAIACRLSALSTRLRLAASMLIALPEPDEAERVTRNVAGNGRRGRAGHPATRP